MPAELVHLLSGIASTGSKRTWSAKCGVEVSGDRKARCATIVAWWTAVDCPECRQAGVDSVGHTEAQATESAA